MSQRGQTGAHATHVHAFLSVHCSTTADSNFFYKSILDENPSCLSGESTPSYLLHSDRVLPRIREVGEAMKTTSTRTSPTAFPRY